MNAIYAFNAIQSQQILNNDMTTWIYGFIHWALYLGKFFYLLFFIDEFYSALGLYSTACECARVWAMTVKEIAGQEFVEWLHAWHFVYHCQTYFTWTAAVRRYESPCAHFAFRRKTNLTTECRRTLDSQLRCGKLFRLSKMCTLFRCDKERKRQRNGQIPAHRLLDNQMSYDFDSVRSVVKRVISFVCVCDPKPAQDWK